ncbi:MAG: MerR family transcriptional regulator [Chitinivibrionales bacterium]|nr:MerR family transcriptional regulator [Chitinivibrionales bacterium]
MEQYLTSGQIARRLRISISTLKRWVNDPGLKIVELRNQNGWRLFMEKDLDALKGFKRELKRNGKRFNETTLIPINVGLVKDKEPSKQTMNVAGIA